MGVNFMAKIATHAAVELRLGIELDEPEARALVALVGYGADSFLKVFYEHLGEHYLKPHEKGLRSLFDSIAETVPEYLQRIDTARKTFKS
jgi:hypothetical protein